MEAATQAWIADLTTQLDEAVRVQGDGPRCQMVM